LKLKQKDNAMRAYQRALDLDPDNNGAAQKLQRARSN
jgi:Tfp pilus assembly protein PilF